MSLVPRIHIDPFGQRPFKDKSSKSIFKEQNFYSHIIKSVNINELTKVFRNDSIIEGMELNNIHLSNNNRTINLSLTPGRIIQDNTLIDILENVFISLDIFSEYDIINVDTDNNYFEVDNDQTNNFPEYKQFAIFDSNTSSFNHKNWIVWKSFFENGKTKIFPSQEIIHNDNSGIIVNDNFPKSKNGTILIMSKYQFQESLHNQPVEFIPVYTRTDDYFTIISRCTPGIDPRVFRIIYGIVYIEKDLEDYIILNDYSMVHNNVRINIHDADIFVRNGIDYVRSIDGGEILIC